MFRRIIRQNRNPCLMGRIDKRLARLFGIGLTLQRFKANGKSALESGAFGLRRPFIHQHQCQI
jgi:uncharacterized membrane protein